MTTVFNKSCPILLLVAAAMCATTGWHLAASCLLLGLVVYRSFQLRRVQQRDKRIHADEIASLQIRSIEALALAVNAKDDTTHNHLKRVQVYAVELGRELGLGQSDLEALRAAAVLHDIGKLAVPEYILSKPGKLSPEEFDKMKTHPLVGAEILDRLQLPIPVVPIVRAHHEKWDGSGYPYGLKGRDIPMGARILSAVDALDALASDRQYRRALPLEEAMKRVAQEAGKGFDPEVVAALERNYREWESKARSENGDEAKLSTAAKITRGAPAAGYECAPGSQSPIADAHGSEVSDTVSLPDFDDYLAIVAARLERAVPYQALALYALQSGTLVPVHVSGEGRRVLSSLRVPLGEGLCGWVAENCKPIINGNPAVEPGYEQRSHEFRSALAVPIPVNSGAIGVLALYSTGRDAFTREHLRLVSPVASKLALWLQYHFAPETRSLLQLERAFAQNSTLRLPLTVPF
jgi:putative nucleotidyltransferase with HDIG domain